MQSSPLIDSRSVAAVRAQYTLAFLIYQRLPKELRRGETWIVTTLVDEYKRLDINEQDSAAILVMVYWV